MTLYVVVLISVMALCYTCRHHKLVNSCDWHTMQFLSEIINIRDDVAVLWWCYPVNERYCVIFWGDGWV